MASCYMSGHSKWSTIKRQKGISDQKRGQAFTKLAGAITIAVRQGGGVSDPNSNFKLRLAIEKARSVNMPKDNIERAIERGKGADKGEGFDEVVYEAFAPGGVSLIVEAATDKKTRTTGDVKNMLEKNGATMGVQGSVLYQFQSKGMITVKKNNMTADDIMLIAADVGADDIEDADDVVLVYTKPDAVAKIKDALTEQGMTVQEFELTRKPITNIIINDKETADKILSLLDKLESLDDVQKVYANFDISDTILAS